MPSLSFSERARIAMLSTDRSRRAAVSRMLASPLLRWRFASRAPDALLIVPQDLRTADPSFWQEVRLGQFGLAGSLADTGELSPFDIVPPTPAWERALHGFGWLRHLGAAESPEARRLARQLVLEWIERSGSLSKIAAEPAVASRRLISWLSQAPLLLDGADQRSYDEILDSFGMQLVLLNATWRAAAPGYPRLLCLIALTLADLCLAGNDHNLEGTERLLAGELQRQILPDGGHISRNGNVLIELMLDLLPMRQCFASRNRATPEPIDAAMRRTLPMLRYLRMGDGMLARFNGVGVASPVGLATVLAYEDTPDTGLAAAPASKYQRLERGETILVLDAGSPPPLHVAGEAHAGCLSFEMSTGSRLFLVNGGAPSGADIDWRPASRATASHNTLCLAETSSSRLIRHKVLEDLVGAPPIRGPENVSASVREDAFGGLVLDGTHDGYAGRHGYRHARHLALDTSGRRLQGRDRLEPADGNSKKLTYAVHFHLHPDVACRRVLTASDTAELEPGDGSVWRFSAEGARLSVEESVFYSDSAGPRRSLQVVLRGTASGETEVRWTLARAERLDSSPSKGEDAAP